MSSQPSSSLTFKQLDALFWVVRLKGFQPAADRLNTTQSAISKRIKDLEVLCNKPLFERGTHPARLTSKGKDLYLLAEELLTLRDKGVKLMRSKESFHRRLRLGCTEFTAMIWLADLLAALGDEFPDMLVEPEVDVSSKLVHQLSTGELDLVIVPRVTADDSSMQTHLGVIQHSWVCRTGHVDMTEPMSPLGLRDHTVLMQRKEHSSAVRTYIHWLRGRNGELGKTISCTNLQGLIGMVRAGMGIGYLPVACIESQLQTGELCLVEMQDQPPCGLLIAAYEPSTDNGFLRAMAAAIKNHCPLPPSERRSDTA